jgi:hypothetical protein
MSIETQNTTPVVTDAAIDAETNRIVAASLAKHNMSIDQLPPGAMEDARRAAKEMLEADARNQSNEYFHLYQQQKQEAEALKAQLGAVRENRTARADTRTVDTMEQVRERVGRATWFQFSEAQKLTALGLDPATVDKNQLRTLFGRNTDTAFAVDFMKTNPYLYKQYRQASLALNITGK